MNYLIKITLFFSLVFANLAFVGVDLMSYGAPLTKSSLSGNERRERSGALDFGKNRYISRLKEEKRLEETLLLVNKRSGNGEFQRYMARLERDDSKSGVVKSVKEQIINEELQGVPAITFYRLTRAEIEEEFLKVKRLSAGDLTITFQRMEKIIKSEYMREELDDVAQRRAALKLAMLNFYKSSGRILNSRTALTITSPQGMRKNPVTGVEEYHPGIDIAFSEKSRYNIYGRNVYSGWSGRVLNDPLKMHPVYGYNVRLEHGFFFEGEFIETGFRSHYSHLRGRGLRAQKDSYVKAGEVLGRVGSTGLSTNPHLDWEVYSSPDSCDKFFTEFFTVKKVTQYGMDFYQVEDLFNQLF